MCIWYLHTVLWHNILETDEHFSSYGNLPYDLFTSLTLGFFKFSKMEQFVTK